MTRKILIVYAHPGIPESRANQRLISAAARLPNVTVRSLYDLYPHGVINAQVEQETLLANDLLVTQYPLFWYSMPSLLKEWVDSVLDYGWAYGPGGDKLKGKPWLHALTTGGKQKAYAPDGYNQHSVDEFLLPQRQTAKLCQMPWLTPRVVYDANDLSSEALDAAAQDYASALSDLSAQTQEL